MFQALPVRLLRNLIGRLWGGGTQQEPDSDSDDDGGGHGNEVD